MTLYRINRDVGLSKDIFMDNSPVKNGYNKEMQGVTGLERIDVRTNETHYPCQNKAESVINIIKGKSKIRRAQRNTLKRVCDIGMI